jgi:hypothetical protein
MTLPDDPDELKLPVEASANEVLDPDLPPSLLAEAPTKLPVLDLVTHLLSTMTTLDLDTEEAGFSEANLDRPSHNLEEALDTSLDEDDEANLES